MTKQFGYFQVKSQGTTRAARLDPVFVHALKRVSAAWLIAACVVVSAQALIAPEHLAVVSVVSLASILVAALALMPGLLADSQKSSQGDYSAPLMASVLLRLVGTVALFLLCRYHLAANDDLLAGIVIGWYVFLTVVEVVALVRRMPGFAASSSHVGSQIEPEMSCKKVSATV